MFCFGFRRQCPEAFRIGRQIGFLGLLESAIGGWGGIRTHEGLAPLPVFKTGAFNRSATHPILAGFGLDTTPAAPG